MDRLQLHWLGLPAVTLKGRPVKLETRKGTALLAYLSLSGPRRVREVVATMFWPEGNQQHALASLRRTLSSLNSRLPGWIEADREVISLRQSTRLWVDVVLFRALVGGVREHCQNRSEICDECRSALERAEELHRGDFLEGLILGNAPQFDDWQLVEREQLRRERGDVLRRLTDNYVALGQWQRAVESSRRWLSLDAFNEAACRATMKAYFHSGDKTSALRQYETLEHLLHEQQGRQPEVETHELYGQLRGPIASQARDGRAQVEPGEPILKTKLYIPSPPANRVERFGLLARLNEIEQHTLTLISAPAGFGKTTLLAEWISQMSLPVAWLSLDPADNDPNRFLSYLAEALEGLHEGVAAETRQLTRSAGPAASQAVMAALINLLGTLPVQAVLVLDDYQFITEHAVHDIVSYLLDHAPLNLRLVVATRADPPLSLARLRAHGQLLEFRTADLRFDRLEASAFLNQVMRLGLSAEDISALEARTEGWVVGLQMAALSLQGHERASEFIRAFSGSHRYVLDYLVEEVLRRQPARILTFLMETSVLDKLSGSLCDALMSEEWRESGDGGQATLEHLEARNLFIIPLDDRKQWYRYHHLFTDLLRSRLQQFPVKRIVSLHARASIWYEDHGFFREAVDHALSARDYQRSAALLDRSLQTGVLLDGPSVRIWISQIPEDITRDHPWIHVSEAWISLSLGKLDGIEADLGQAEACLQEGRGRPMSDVEAEDLRGHVAMLRAYVAFFQGHASTTIEQATLAMERVRKSNTFLRSRIALQLGEAHFVLGELESSARRLREAIRLSTEDRDYAVATTAYFRLGGLLKVQGRLAEAEQAYRQNLRDLEEIGARESPLAGKPEIGLGDLLRERGELAAAQVLLSVGHEHSLLQAQPYDLVYSYVGNARLAEAQGRGAVALELMSQAEPLFLASTNPPVVRLDFECDQVGMWLRSAKLGLAERWVVERQLDSRLEPTFGTESLLIALARVRIAQKRLSEAAALLGRLAAGAESGGRNGRLIEILILLSISLDAQGMGGQALGALTKAIGLAEPEGYMRLFLDGGKPIAALLERLQASDLAPGSKAYVDRLLAAAGTAKGPSA